MKKVKAAKSREELAALISDHLRKHEIDVVLVGGAVVSIYTNNLYESRDLDFISSSDHAKIKQAMQELGFEAKGKDFVHQDIEWTVEFPTGPIALGEQVPVEPEGNLQVGKINVKILSPTQSVMDRLCWFFHYNDRQCLDQAVWIAQNQPVSIEKITKWSEQEGEREKLMIFLEKLKK